MSETQSGCVPGSLRCASSLPCGHVVNLVGLAFGRSGGDGDWRWSFSRRRLAAGSAITGECFWLIVTMRIGLRRRFDCALENGIISGRQCVAVIATGSAVERRIEGTNINAFTDSSAVPVGVIV